MYRCTVPTCTYLYTSYIYTGQVGRLPVSTVPAGSQQGIGSEDATFPPSYVLPETSYTVPGPHVITRATRVDARSRCHACSAIRLGKGRQPTAVLPSTRTRGAVRWVLTPVCACTQRFSTPENL